jgi:hypothetical protein
LYHAPVALKTERKGSKLYMAALEPPGNIAAEVARYRRLFFAPGGGSARAFPELLPLAFARGVATRRRIGPRAAGGILGEAWPGIEGSFRSGSVFMEGGLAYLGVEGPLAELVAALGPILPRLGLEACAGPLALGAGFFLYRPLSAGEAIDAAPPSLSFAVCRLCLFKLELDEDPLAAMAWTELAAALRPGRRA